MTRSMFRSAPDGVDNRLHRARLAGAIAIGLFCAGPLIAQAQPVHADKAGTRAVGQQQQQSATDQDTSKAKKKKTKAGTQQKNATKLSTVVVTGIRSSLMSAQDRKRNADQIIESVTALDIGALPDRTVTDTLSRMSGVTVDRFAAPGDADHPSAEGSGIQIRGMSQVRAELNGGDVFSANSGRGLSWQDVPSELLSGVDIYMDPNAAIPEGGIGGTVNLRTRLPFDQKGRMMAFNFGVNSGDLSHKGKPSASFLYSNRWQTENHGEFGALFDVAYSGMQSRSDGVQNEPYLRRTDPALLAGTNFNQVYVSDGVDWRTLDFTRKRIGLDGALQWRPNDKFEISTQALRSSYTMSWIEHAAFFNDSGPTYDGSEISGTSTGILPAAGTQFTYSPTGVFQSGYLTSNSWRGALAGNGVRFETDTRDNQQFTVTTDWSTKFKWNISDDTVLNGGVQFVKSTSRSQDFTVFDALYLPGFYIDETRQTHPLISITPSDYVDNKANYFWSAAMDHVDSEWAMERAYHLDLKHYFEDSSWARSLAFGARTTNLDEVDHYSPYNWGALTDNWLTIPNSATGTGLADLGHYLPNDSTWYSFSNFFRGNLSVPSMYFPVLSLAQNRLAAYDSLKTVEGAGGWTPYGDYQPGDLNIQSEKTQALYGVLFFGSPNGFMDGNVGVRVVRTASDVDGHVQYPDLASNNVSQAMKDEYHGQSEPYTGGRTYTNVLPSLNLNMHLTNDLQWRWAVSKAMSRPTFDQLKGYVSLGATANTANTAITGWTGTAGNPNLKPMVAKQFDTSLEWYFNATGHIYGTWFMKNIANYISEGVETVQYGSQDFTVTRPYNHGTGRVRGAQFSYQQFFHFLPGWLQGFGVQTNYTYVHSVGGVNAGAQYSVPLPMVGLSKNAFNFIVMYDHGPWSGRLAWNWRSQYLLSTTDAGSHLPVWAGKRGALDASLFYRFSKNIQVGLRLNNLNNARTRVLMGPTVYTDGFVDPTLYTRGTFVTDRRAELLIRMKL
ncbi:MAG TPA: TonB-dependent receptor [Rhodanobacteraceae bacterium]